MARQHPFRRERRLKDLSQHYCALRAGISQTKLSLIEHGYALPTSEEAEILAEVVGAEVGDLFPMIRCEAATARDRSEITS